MTTSPIRIVLADDHPILRKGLLKTLAVEVDIMLVGEASDGTQAQHLCRELQPTVLLLDLHMPGPTATETVVYVRQHCPTTQVLILTMMDDDTSVQEMLTAGVVGYLLKDEATAVVVQAIRTVAQGKTWFSPTIAKKVVRWKKGTSTHWKFLALTAREQEILGLIAQGWGNLRIATQLNLSEQTVRNYASRIYARLGVNSRAEAIMWAREHGIYH